MKIDPKLVEDAINTWPFDGKEYPRARAAIIAVLEQLIAALDGPVPQLDLLSLAEALVTCKDPRKP